jgi:hypothetical protein
MCPHRYKRYRKSQSYVREWPGRELTFVLANRVRMDQLPVTTTGRSRAVAALPPLPHEPEPYTSSTTSPSDCTPKYACLVLPCYLFLWASAILLFPVWVLLGGIIECLAKVGLLPYIERPLRYLVLSPTLFAARTTFWIFGELYDAIVGLCEKCTLIALRYIARFIALTAALLLLASCTFSRLVYRLTGIVLCCFHWIFYLWTARKHPIVAY